MLSLPARLSLLLLLLTLVAYILHTPDLVTATATASEEEKSQAPNQEEAELLPSDFAPNEHPPPSSLAPDPTLQREGYKPKPASFMEVVVPFGTLMGIGNGVPAYSNGNTDFYSASKAHLNGFWTGVKWQCVEYARRYWLHHFGCRFLNIPTADMMYREVKYAEKVDDGSHVPVTAHPNGGPDVPEVGDLLIYRVSDDKVYDAPFGHVAVIVEVDMENGEVLVADQNYGDEMTWDNPSYARKLPMVLRPCGGNVPACQVTSCTITDFGYTLHGWLRLDPSVTAKTT